MFFRFQAIIFYIKSIQHGIENIGGLVFDPRVGLKKLKHTKDILHKL